MSATESVTESVAAALALPLLQPQWNAPPRVRAVMTTRLGGSSPPPFDSLNLGYSTADAPQHVADNERRLLAALGLRPEAMAWVRQVHGVDVVQAEALPPAASGAELPVAADAVVSRTPGRVCAIKVADCMPVLFAADDGSVVAAAHAGWRGLSGGVLERTIAACGHPPVRLQAWLGPCIGPQAFEVGAEVRAAFIEADPDAAGCFRPRPEPERSGKFWCDLYTLAQQRLQRAGVTQISGAFGRCTFSEPTQFFSHRRDGARSGRMAALVWIEA